MVPPLNQSVTDATVNCVRKHTLPSGTLKMREAFARITFSLLAILNPEAILRSSYDRICGTD
jgi:hypothetical protein